MKKGLLIIAVCSLFASAGCYSPPAVAKDVGLSQVCNYEKMVAPLEAISPVMSAEFCLTGYMADKPLSAEMVGNIVEPVKIIEISTSTAVGRAIRMRHNYALNSKTTLIKKNIQLYRPLHIDPGLRNC